MPAPPSLSLTSQTNKHRVIPVRTAAHIKTYCSTLILIFSLFLILRFPKKRRLKGNTAQRQTDRNSVVFHYRPALPTGPLTALTAPHSESHYQAQLPCHCRGVNTPLNTKILKQRITAPARMDRMEEERRWPGIQAGSKTAHLRMVGTEGDKDRWVNMKVGGTRMSLFA